jgi:hypothetical protein
VLEGLRYTIGRVRCYHVYAWGRCRASTVPIARILGQFLHPRVLSIKKKTMSRGYAGVTHQVGTAVVPGLLATLVSIVQRHWEGDNACSCHSKTQVRDAIIPMTRANVGVGAIERAGDAVTLPKCVRCIVCAPQGSSVETVDCVCGGRHTWGCFLASPAVPTLGQAIVRMSCRVLIVRWNAAAVEGVEF